MEKHLCAAMRLAVREHQFDAWLSEEKEMHIAVTPFREAHFGASELVVMSFRHSRLWSTSRCKLVFAQSTVDAGDAVYARYAPLMQC